MYTSTSLKLVVDEITIPYLVLVTFIGVRWNFMLFVERSTRRYKVLHESGPILHEGRPAQRMVLKAISKNGASGFLAARNRDMSV